MTAPTWLPVPGWVGYYEVSDLGEVRSLARRIAHVSGLIQPVRSRILRPAPNPKGYLLVVLARDGKRVGRSVHSLVAEAFIGPRPLGAMVCHSDGDPTNNRVENLRYGTQSENEADKRAHGRCANANKTHCPHGHAYDAANTGLDRAGGRYCKTCKRERIRARRAVVAPPTHWGVRTRGRAS